MSPFDKYKIIERDNINTHAVTSFTSQNKRRCCDGVRNGRDVADWPEHSELCRFHRRYSLEMMISVIASSGMDLLES